jgi:TonB family protein
VLSRPSNAPSKPVAADSAAVPASALAVAIAVSPTGEKPHGPGIRILRVESEPSGAGVSDRGVEVCMQTPCEIYWRGDSAAAEHKLTLTKRGFRTALLTVAPSDEKVTGKLDAWTTTEVGAAVGVPTPAAPAATASATASASTTATAAAVVPIPVAVPAVVTAAPAPTPEPAVVAPPPPVATAAAPVAHVEEGMTAPVRVSGGNPTVPREAREAKVEGTVVAKCIITEAGSTSGCRIVKGLPFMDAPVLAALAGWKFTPAQKDGKPIAVDRALTIKIKAQ